MSTNAVWADGQSTLAMLSSLPVDSVWADGQSVIWLLQITYVDVYPIADISLGDWLPSSGLTLWPMLDEPTTPDDNDYIYAPTAPDANVVCEVKMDDPGTPGDGTVRVLVRTRHA